RLLHPELYDITSNREFQVVQDGISSASRTIRSRVPQGSVLGPTLYSLFMLKNSKGRKDVCTATYDDDTAVHCRSECIYEATDTLQQFLKKFENWACRWNVA
ncbi:hypothetical protein KR038_002246, partial [Drosophila bunnanda]